MHSSYSYWIWREQSDTHIDDLVIYLYPEEQLITVQTPCVYSAPTDCVVLMWSQRSTHTLQCKSIHNDFYGSSYIVLSGFFSSQPCRVWHIFNTCADVKLVCVHKGKCESAQWFTAYVYVIWLMRKTTDHWNNNHFALSFVWLSCDARACQQHKYVCAQHVSLHFMMVHVRGSLGL